MKSLHVASQALIDDMFASILAKQSRGRQMPKKRRFSITFLSPQSSYQRPLQRCLVLAVVAPCRLPPAVPWLARDLTRPGGHSFGSWVKGPCFWFEDCV